MLFIIVISLTIKKKKKAVIRPKIIVTSFHFNFNSGYLVNECLIEAVAKEVLYNLAHVNKTENLSFHFQHLFRIIY